MCAGWSQRVTHNGCTYLHYYIRSKLELYFNEAKADKTAI